MDYYKLSLFDYFASFIRPEVCAVKQSVFVDFKRDSSSKNKNLSTPPHPYVPNLYEFLSSAEHKIIYFAVNIPPSMPTFF